MIATSDFLTSLECTKFDFGRGSAPDPAGELTALPRPPSVGLRGHKRGGKETGKEAMGLRGRGRRGTENGGNGREGVGMPGKGEGKGGRRGGEGR